MAGGLSRVEGTQMGEEKHLGEKKHPLAQQLGCATLQEQGKPRNTAQCNIPLCLGSNRINTSLMRWVKQ